MSELYSSVGSICCNRGKLERAEVRSHKLLFKSFVRNSPRTTKQTHYNDAPAHKHHKIANSQKIVVKSGTRNWEGQMSPANDCSTYNLLVATCHLKLAPTPTPALLRQ